MSYKTRIFWELFRNFILEMPMPLNNELTIDLTAHPFTVESESLDYTPRFSNLLCAARTLVAVSVGLMFPGKVVYRHDGREDTWDYQTCVQMVQRYSPIPNDTGTYRETL